MVRLTIDIREELVTRWGGIFIEGFEENEEGNLQYGHLSVPGFEYTLPENKSDATFEFKMERIVNDAEKKRGKKKSGIRLLTDEGDKEGKPPPIDEDNGANHKPDGRDESTIEETGD